MKKQKIMDCRNFLKTASGSTLPAAGATTGVSRVFADVLSSPVTGKLSGADIPDIDSTMEYRKPGGMDVSGIGLGCLPMAGHCSRKYDKWEMFALIRRAYGKGVKKNTARHSLIISYNKENVYEQDSFNFSIQHFNTSCDGTGKDSTDSRAYPIG